MVTNKSSRWRLDRRIDLSVLLQIMTLASLIVGSWINIQRQLDQLQRDVTVMLDTQKTDAARLDTVTTQAIGHEYRLQSVEKRLNQSGLPVF
jgi:hypothetical protein